MFNFDEGDVSDENPSVLSRSNPKLVECVADVTILDSLLSMVDNNEDNIGAMIFAASASVKGGNAFAVDCQGFINAAQCCI